MERHFFFKKEIVVELFNSSKIDVQELKLTSFTYQVAIQTLASFTFIYDCQDYSTESLSFPFKK